MKKIEIYPSKHMNPLCEQAGCEPQLASKHAWKWEKKRWHSHPLRSFVKWWQPYDIDTVSGASIGGHPDAWRIWARKDPGRWVRKRYGVSLIDAWNTLAYVEEFNAWQDAGSPESDFVSVALTLEEQKARWQPIKAMLAKMPSWPK